MEEFFSQRGVPQNTTKCVLICLELSGRVKKMVGGVDIDSINVCQNLKYLGAEIGNEGVM